jgi:hypothetical protein
MKTRLIATFAAVALATSAYPASASWFHWGTSKSSSATHSVSLTDAQQKLTLKDIEQSGQVQTKPTNFTASVGATVPNVLALKPVPAGLGQQVKALKSYDYALLQRELLIVSPINKKIVDVINRPA